MMTEFQRQKHVRYFDVLDANKNGFLAQDDFEEVAQRFASVRGIQPDDPRFGAIRTRLMSNWDRMQPDIDQNRDGRASLDEWLAFEDRVVFQATPAEYEAHVNGIVQGLFDLVDTDGDNAISAEDFRKVYYGFRLDEDQAEEAFRHMDANGDGRIDRDEMNQVVREFHMSDDPAAPGNWLFGPIGA